VGQHKNQYSIPVVSIFFKPILNKKINQHNILISQMYRFIDEADSSSISDIGYYLFFINGLRCMPKMLFLKYSRASIVQTPSGERGNSNGIYINPYVLKYICSLFGIPGTQLNYMSRYIILSSTKLSFIIFITYCS